MKIASLFRLTATVTLVQIALGGLVTFSFIGPLIHIGWGVVVGAIALATSIVALRSRPVDPRVRGVSFGVVAALVVQGILGFATLALTSDALAWVHLVLGVLIYAMALSGMYFAQMQPRMPAIEGEKEPQAVEMAPNLTHGN